MESIDLFKPTQPCSMKQLVESHVVDHVFVPGGGILDGHSAMCIGVLKVQDFLLPVWPKLNSLPTGPNIASRWG